jgi:peroxiredoxin
MGLKSGDMAPNFKLSSMDQAEVNLSDYSGRSVVILFFPKAYTSVCTAELCSIRDNKANYDKLGTDVIAISVDPLDVLNKFKEEQGFNFDLLSDSDKQVSASYGALYEDPDHKMHGLAKRSAFIVDKKGIIRYAEVLKNAGELPNFAAINETLAQLN